MQCGPPISGRDLLFFKFQSSGQTRIIINSQHGKLKNRPRSCKGGLLDIFCVVNKAAPTEVSATPTCMSQTLVKEKKKKEATFIGVQANLAVANPHSPSSESVVSRTPVACSGPLKKRSRENKSYWRQNERAHRARLATHIPPLQTTLAMRQKDRKLSMP